MSAKKSAAQQQAQSVKKEEHLPATTVAAGVAPHQLRRQGRTLPIVENLVIPPHKRSQEPLLSRLVFRFYAETAMGTLEPWERAITNAVVIAILAIVSYQFVTTVKVVADYASLLFITV